MNPIIEFKHVGKSYGEKKIIEDLNLSILPNEIFVLVGPSGSGKTTTLKMINGLSTATEGDIYFKHQKLTDYDIQKMRWQMGYVLQQIALFPTMTVKENIEVIPEMLGWKKERRSERVDELLEQVGLEPALYRERMPKELSGGEEQRIGILRAIAAQPDLILMDEPFSALDPISRLSLQELVINLQRELKNTIVFVTHNMNEAIKLGDRIAVMKNGQVVQCDTPDKIQKEPANEFVQTFFEETEENRSLSAISVKELMSQKQASAKKLVEHSLCICETAKLGELFSLLAKEPAVSIVNDKGEYIGEITQSDVFAFLSEREDG